MKQSDQRFRTYATHNEAKADLMSDNSNDEESPVPDMMKLDGHSDSDGEKSDEEKYNNPSDSNEEESKGLPVVKG